jgi:F-type H+-transporting ATPase subunit delta
MAKRSDIPFRYAVALLDAAEERGVLPRVRVEIGGLRALIGASGDLSDFLQDRAIPPEAKQRILSQIFEGKVQEITLNFLLLVVSRQRERFLPDILAACQAILDEREGIVDADAVSAVGLTPAQEDLLKARLGSYTGKRIRMRTRVDPALIGGFIVRVGDTVFDSSLAMQLQRIRHGLTGQ